MPAGSLRGEGRADYTLRLPADPELPPINLVTGEPQQWEPGPSLSNSFGFGGHNGTLVLGPGA